MAEAFAWSRSLFSPEGDEITVGVTVPGEIHLRIKSAPLVPSGDSGAEAQVCEVSLSPVHAAELSEGLASSVSGRLRVLKGTPRPERY